MRMYDPYMESGELIPSGEPVPCPADAPPKLSQAQEAPRVRHALILPVVFALAAWAVDRFTQSTLGDWRYVPVAVLGVCAVYFTVLAVVVAVALNIEKLDGHVAPRRLTRTTNVVFVVLTVAAVIVEFIRAVRDHSVIDAVTALGLAVLALFLIPGSMTFTTMSRSRRRTYRAACLLLPIWILVVTFFHLH
jgi:hypothetical protein